MKTISPGLKLHLSHPVTTLATCWYIIRIDGSAWGFTTFDEDLVIDGVIYSSVAGFSRTAISTGSVGEVDNLNVVGFFHDDGITARDIRNGLFDYASIWVFCVNWMDLTAGICRLRRGWIGECTISESGVFMAELRGLTQALVQEFGSVYMPICRADLGDTKCKMPIVPSDWYPGQAVNAGDYRRALTDPTDALKVAIFQAAGGGTTGSVEPAWVPAIGATTMDNGIAWVSMPYWRSIASVVSTMNAKQFVSTPIVIPADTQGLGTGVTNNAQIFVMGPVSSGTSITVSDGVISHSILSSEDVSQVFAYNYISQFFGAFRDWSLTVTSSGNQVSFTNTVPGRIGQITKGGDTHNGILIRDFGALPFAGGHVTWLDGDNVGRSMEIKEYDGATGIVTLWLGMYFQIKAGDRFFVYPGCNKRRDTCVFTFNNILNFRAEPDMPMLDRTLSYPDS